MRASALNDRHMLLPALRDGVVLRCYRLPVSVGIRDLGCYIPSVKPKPNLDLLRSIAVLLVVVEHTLLAMRIRSIGT